ncbi:BspA family leucine-rich repeat surface protein [Mycoplasma capricolum subsp. capripneumoniae]|nr:BspA family leucine-rich repeat surface protein [Mycoplasma capricolum]QIN42912.1 BspA family leucine-rich repeat surface protein [Mycoplasma capricolum subsp. capripneumoniae]QIN50474.1 BspA family leucine-rich repeat surface protein [Mycoplasma capricolum subsp. capripneumoniae]
MKKILTILTSFSLIVTSSFLVVACKTNESEKKIEIPKGISEASFKKEDKRQKNLGSKAKMSHSDNPNNAIEKKQVQNKNSNFNTFEKGDKHNILSKIEDGRDFLTKNYKWVKMNKTGNVDHIINPHNPNEILFLGYERDTNLKDGYKLKKIPNNVNKAPTYLPKFITSLEKSFQFNSNEKIRGIEKWNTKNVKNMFQMFFGAKNFNYDISDWDTSNVENMSYMFSGAESFKQNLSKWKVEKSPFPFNFAQNSGFENNKSLWPEFKNKYNK